MISLGSAAIHVESRQAKRCGLGNIDSAVLSRQLLEHLRPAQQIVGVRSSPFGARLADVGGLPDMPRRSVWAVSFSHARPAQAVYTNPGNAIVASPVLQSPRSRFGKGKRRANCARR
jgi:hypothetical protein